MIFLPKCRALCVDLEKGHDAGKKGMALEKRAWRGAIVKVVRGNTKPPQNMVLMGNTVLSLSIIQSTF